MKWINVNSTLPPKTGAYLIASKKDGGVWIGFWISEKWLDDDGDEFDFGGAKVTHWQEFPDPPA